MSSTTTVAIAGLSGRLARLITKALLAKPNVVIHGLVRDPSKVSHDVASDPRVKIFKGDSESIDAIRSALRGASVVICCYMGPDSVVNQGQKILIDAAIAEKVPRYIASDFSFDYRGLKLGDIPMKDFQLTIDEYLAQKESEGLIRAVHILNGAFTEVMFSSFLDNYDPAGKSFNHWGSGDEVYEMSTYEDTAKFTAEVALDSSANGHLKLVVDRLSLKQIRDIHNSIYQTDFAIHQRGSVGDLINAAKTAQAERPQEWFSWVGLLFTYYIINGATHIQDDDNHRYALDLVDMKRLLRNYKQEDLPKLMEF